MSLYNKFSDYSIQLNQYRYPNPFFDISNHYIPTNLKELFKWFEYIIFTNPILAGAIYNLVSYPITEPIIEGGDKDKILDYLEEINWRSFFIDVGLNRYVYGNAFIVFFPPFDREFICPRCGNVFSDQLVEFEFKEDNFITTCPKCKYHGAVTYRELPNKSDINRAVFKLWNPKLIGLKIHPITDKKEYYSDLPKRIRYILAAGNDEFYLRDTPVNIIRAAKKGQQIKFKSNYVYHMRTRSLAGYNSEWGISPLMPVLKHLFHIQILRKANEAIAWEHIVPLRVIFPQVDINTAQMVNFAAWVDSFREAINNWRIDQNHIYVSNVPVGTQYIGGQYKMLEVNNYIDMLVQEVSAGLGIPKEFIFGGLTWSGSSVSLRMLENQLSTYIGELRDLFKWMVNKLCDFFDLKKPDVVDFVPFKMIDDVQQKQFLLELAVNNKISTKTLMQALGLDFEKEIQLMKEEVKIQSELQYIQQGALAELQAKVQQDMIERAQEQGLSPEELQQIMQDGEQEQVNVPKINKELGEPYPEQKPSERTQLGV